jgi:hypothetical protein
MSDENVLKFVRKAEQPPRDNYDTWHERPYFRASGWVTNGMVVLDTLEGPQLDGARSRRPE